LSKSGKHFDAVTAAVSKTCLVSFDKNKYSVTSLAVGRPVEVQAYADHIVIRQDGAVVAEHTRCFGRGETIYNPWHYVPVLTRKPGARCLERCLLIATSKRRADRGQTSAAQERRAIQELGSAGSIGSCAAQIARLQ